MENLAPPNAEMWHHLTNERQAERKAEKMSGWDMYEKLLEYIGAENLLDSLARALSDDELAENMLFIAQTEDIELEED